MKIASDKKDIENFDKALDEFGRTIDRGLAAILNVMVDRFVTLDNITFILRKETNQILRSEFSLETASGLRIPVSREIIFGPLRLAVQREIDAFSEARRYVGEWVRKSN